MTDIPEMTTRLKPCPWCDSDRVRVCNEAWVECFAYGAHGPIRASTAPAVASWNERPWESAA